MRRASYSAAMPRLDQFEVWVFQGSRWELAAAFFDLETASAVANNRRARVKLVHATYEEGRLTSSEILAEIGNIRNAS